MLFWGWLIRLLALSEQPSILNLADLLKAAFYESADLLNGFGDFADVLDEVKKAVEGSGTI